MLISNIQRFSTKNNYNLQRKNTISVKKQFSQDVVNFRGNNETQLYEALKIAKLARNGDKDALELITKAMELAKSTKTQEQIVNSSETYAVKDLANVFQRDCFEGKNAHEYDVYNYPRIYRFIGDSEYKSLIKDKRITSKVSNNPGIDVTNNINYRGAHSEGEKIYLVTFKLKDNLDAFLAQCPRKHLKDESLLILKNRATSEFILNGGYSLDDVENILETETENLSDGKIVYGQPTKKIPIELENEKAKIKPNKVISDLKIESSLIDDGINDINPTSIKQGNEIISPFEEFLQKENTALAPQNVNLPEDIPKIEIGDIEIPKIDAIEDLSDIPKEIEKSAKSLKSFKPILLVASIGTAIIGLIYLISKKNKKYGKNIDKTA